MTKAAQGSTRDQLRSLISSHIENAAALPPGPIVSKSVAAVEPPKPAVTKPILPIRAVSRQSLRLIPTELSQINAIINRTLEQTGERATVTDVLRVGLKRLGDSACITQAEVALLRTSDGRRQRGV